MKKLFKKHYKAIIKRGLITDKTTLDDFFEKIKEESIELFESETDEQLRQEAIDLICTAMNMLIWMDADIETELIKNIETQEKRANNEN